MAHHLVLLLLPGVALGPRVGLHILLEQQQLLGAGLGRVPPPLRRRLRRRLLELADAGLGAVVRGRLACIGWRGVAATGPGGLQSCCGLLLAGIHPA